MEVLGYDLCPYAESKIKYVPKEEVLSKADYITIHTGGKNVIVGEHELSLMKPTAYVINTSRGANIDQEALYNALKEKRIAGAALDVYEQEPKGEGSQFQNKLRQLDNVVFTAHLGASTVEAQRETSIEIAKVVTGYLFAETLQTRFNAGESIDSKINPSTRYSSTTETSQEFSQTSTRFWLKRHQHTRQLFKTDR
jgi:D-3-phosphoglycerate dehydrogenase